MIDPLQVAAILVSLLLLGVVVELVRRKKLTEEYSFIWIACALALLVASVARHALDQLALSVGIYYPPAALLILLVLFVFLASVSFSVVVSRQRQQIERLIEDAALLEAEVREMKDNLPR
jgi:hypothetical protein